MYKVYRQRKQVEEGRDQARCLLTMKTQETYHGNGSIDSWVTLGHLPETPPLDGSGLELAQSGASGAGGRNGASAPPSLSGAEVHLFS